MKQSHIREWEENNVLINFNCALIRRKKKREIKDKTEAQVINLKANLSYLVGRSSSLLEWYRNEQSCWETPYK